VSIGRRRKAAPVMAEDKRCNRGTSLVELLVVLALIGLMVLVAADLVIHSINLLGATGRSVRNPLVVHVITRLRRDVEDAAKLKTVETVWNDHALELWTHDGEIVHIERRGDRLVHETRAAAGAEVTERVLLRGVTQWWWRSPVPGVVDLRIGYLVNPEPENQASRKPGWRRVRRTENLRFAIRGGGGGRRW